MLEEQQGDQNGRSEMRARKVEDGGWNGGKG